MFLVYLKVLSIWIGGPLTLPIAMLCYYMKWYLFPSILLFYYGYTYIFPFTKDKNAMKGFRLLEDSYFKNNQIIYEENTIANNQTLFCILPHGVLTIGALNFITSLEIEKYNISFLITDVLFKVPIAKDVCNLLGFGSIKKENLIKLMENRSNIAILPGGFEEASMYEYEKYKIYINNRKGFIKYILKYGYNINPVFVFGEEKTYKTLFVGFFQKLGKFLNPYGIPSILFYGKYFTPFPFNDGELNIVVGKQINFPTIKNPSDEEIDKYHDLYKKEVIQLFKRNVGKYGNKESELILN